MVAAYMASSNPREAEREGWGDTGLEDVGGAVPEDEGCGEIDGEGGATGNTVTAAPLTNEVEM